MPVAQLLTGSYSGADSEQEPPPVSHNSSKLKKENLVLEKGQLHLPPIFAAATRPITSELASQHFHAGWDVNPTFLKLGGISHR